jgi:hypothetical protein
MKNPKPIVLWAVPRSVSTAFERVFVERGDFRVFHEPFSVSYYFGPERRSDRFAGKEPKDKYRHENVLAELLAPGDKPVFIKDMAYHAAGFMDREFAAKFTNSFIIREPKQVLSSLRGMWPDFTTEEAGYEQLYRLSRYSAESGQESVIVDAQDLSEDTEGTVAAYCEALGIPFEPEALSWEPREVPEWKTWDEWHTDVQESTGIGEISREDVSLPTHLRGVYERCLPYYEELHKERLRPGS